MDNNSDIEIVREIDSEIEREIESELENLSEMDIDSELEDDFDADRDIYIEKDLIAAYIDDIRKYKILTKEEEVELLIKIKEGDEEARNQFILSNLRLVVNIAKGYVNRGMSFVDLVSEGNFGLMHAIDKFELERGFRFSTYAVCWIKQYISKAVINKGRDIRLPSYKYDLIGKINKYISKKLREDGYKPDNEEISYALNIPLRKIEKIFVEFQDTMSLNMSIGEDIYLEDTVPSEYVATLEDDIIESMEHADINQMVETLSPREKEILKLRFGLDGREIHTLEDIGAAFKITRERVRQIEKRTLEKLRLKYIQKK